MSTQSNTADTRGRIAGLDGLRAISILLVLGAHVYGTQGFPQAPWAIQKLFFNGALGVSVFFVISGYLISSLLLREIDATGRIDMKGFYIRRVLRIFPAYYALVLVVVAMRLFGAIALGSGELASMLTYTRNFVPHGTWQTGHLWSLAIEEQFYMFWPFALLRLGKSGGTKMAVAIVAAAPFVRIASWILLPNHRVMHDQFTFTRIDSIMIGCLLALVHQEAWFKSATTRFFDKGGALLAFAVLVASVLLRAFTPHDVVTSFTIEGICAALIIQYCVTRPESRATRMLEVAPLRKIGDYSYSLYVWQQLFLNRHSDSPLCSFPLNIALVVVTAIASRELIEKPFLKLKHRFEPKRRVAAPTSSAPRPPAHSGRPSLA